MNAIPAAGSVYRGSKKDYHGWMVVAATRCHCLAYCLHLDSDDRVQALVEEPLTGVWRILWDARPASFENPNTTEASA